MSENIIKLLDIKTQVTHESNINIDFDPNELICDQCEYCCKQNSP